MADQGPAAAAFDRAIAASAGPDGLVASCTALVLCSAGVLHGISARGPRLLRRRARADHGRGCRGRAADQPLTVC